MDALCIGSRREVCWDEFLMDTVQNVHVQMHKPEYRGDAMHMDKPWEGNVCTYFTVVTDGLFFRLYYLGLHIDVDEFGNDIRHKPYLCYAESRDGKTFHRVNTHMCQYWGTDDNNIIKDDIHDNLSVYKDTNPDCPPDELYKGLGSAKGQKLLYYKSADGVRFTLARVLCDDGAYDSMNTCFWDPHTKQYFLFYRGVHGGSAAENGKWGKAGDRMHNDLIRDIRMRTSRDFVHWEEPHMLQYGPDAPDIELYTNNMLKYPRADHMFLGLPMRYNDRYREPESFPQLPDWKHRQNYIRKYGRWGTVVTDLGIMTSRDGMNFRRTEEAFMTAGIERGTNWYYGDCKICYGMTQTAADVPGAPDELSLYFPVDYRARPVTLRRYSLRLDGFFSWRCDAKPGKVITKPLTFTGDRLDLNFSTSAFGSIRVRILDAEGTPLEGYDSGSHFGDSVDRQLSFQKPLQALAGQPVRLEFTMYDCDLYSFKFHETPKIC